MFLPLCLSLHLRENYHGFYSRVTSRWKLGGEVISPAYNCVQKVIVLQIGHRFLRFLGSSQPSSYHDSLPPPPLPSISFCCFPASTVYVWPGWFLCTKGCCIHFPSVFTWENNRVVSLEGKHKGLRWCPKCSRLPGTLFCVCLSLERKPSSSSSNGQVVVVPYPDLCTWGWVVGFQSVFAGRTKPLEETV